MNHIELNRGSGMIWYLTTIFHVPNHALKALFMLNNKSRR